MNIEEILARVNTLIETYEPVIGVVEAIAVKVIELTKQSGGNVGTLDQELDRLRVARQGITDEIAEWRRTHPDPNAPPAANGGDSRAE